MGQKTIKLKREQWLQGELVADLSPERSTTTHFPRARTEDPPFMEIPLRDERGICLGTTSGVQRETMRAHPNNQRHFLDGWLQDKGKVWGRLKRTKVGKRGEERNYALCTETSHPQISSKIPLKLTNRYTGTYRNLQRS